MRIEGQGSNHIPASTVNPPLLIVQSEFESPISQQRTRNSTIMQGIILYYQVKEDEKDQGHGTITKWIA